MKAILIILATLAGACAATASTSEQQEGTAMTLPEDGQQGISPYAVGIILAAALGGGGYVCGRKHNVQISPQPFLVDIKKEFVSRAEFEQHKKSNSDEQRHLHQRIDALAPSVAEMRGELRGVSENTRHILQLLLNKDQ